MVIDEIKKEMVEFGFDQNQIDNAIEIIYFIGVGQDLAWREGEGIIRSDVSINKFLLKFLKQGYILEDESKYKKYPIYKLNVQGEEIFQELVEANKPNFEGFKNEFLELNPKTFSLLSLPDNANNKDIDRLEVRHKYRTLFDNSKKGDALKKIFNNQIHDFNKLLEKYDLIRKLTRFQSNRIFNKSRFIKGNDFYQLLIEYIESFPIQSYDSISELNTKVSLFDDLIMSIQNVEIRDEISNKYFEFYDEYKFLIENLKENKITTQFNSSKSPCFKIIDEQKFKNEIQKLKKEYIDKVTNPIIDELIGVNLDTSSQHITQYDIALSFAGEQRAIAESIAYELKKCGISLFYDKFEQSKLWGKKQSEYFQLVYGSKTRYVVILISKEYPIKDWTNFEFTIACEEAKKRPIEFILPVRIDGTQILGLQSDVAYLDLNEVGVEGIVKNIINKLGHL